MFFIVICFELRASYEKIWKVNDSALNDRHYQLQKASLKKYPKSLQKAKGFLSEFVKSVYHTYYNP